jgi:phage terminase large subunit-like protein
MKERGELLTLGDRVVPAPEFLQAIMRQLDGWPVQCLVADRYRQAEVEEALAAAGLRIPVVWRGQGFRDGGEDTERFRRAAFDGQIAVRPSLLLRSAMSEAVTVQDDAGNRKIAKARSNGRIDAAAAATLAVAQGQRQRARPAAQGRAPVWV